MCLDGCVLICKHTDAEGNAHVQAQLDSSVVVWITISSRAS